MTKFEREINIAVNKYSKRLSKEDKEDLRQEARMAIFAAREALSNIETPERLAYRLAEARVIDVLRKRPPDCLDIDKPSVRNEAEITHVHFPDMETVLDAGKAAKIVDGFPEDDRFILQSLFGIGRVQLNEFEVAEVMGRNRAWVAKRKERALARIRKIITSKGKEG